MDAEKRGGRLDVPRLFVLSWVMINLLLSPLAVFAEPEPVYQEVLQEESVKLGAFGGISPISFDPEPVQKDAKKPEPVSHTTNRPFALVFFVLILFTSLGLYLTRRLELLLLVALVFVFAQPGEAFYDVVSNTEEWFVCNATGGAPYDTITDVAENDTFPNPQNLDESLCVCVAWSNNNYGVDYYHTCDSVIPKKNCWSQDEEGNSAPSASCTKINDGIYDTHPNVLSECGYFHTGNGEVIKPEADDWDDTDYGSIFDYVYGGGREDRGIVIDDQIDCTDTWGADSPGRTCNLSQGKECIGEDFIRSSGTGGLGEGEICCISVTGPQPACDYTTAQDYQCSDFQNYGLCADSEICMGKEINTTDSNMYDDSNPPCCRYPQKNCFVDEAGSLLNYNPYERINESYICYEENGNSVWAECCSSDKCYNLRLQNLVGTPSIDFNVFGTGSKLHMYMSYDRNLTFDGVSGFLEVYRKDTVSVRDSRYYHFDMGQATNENKYDFSNYKYLEFTLMYSDSHRNHPPRLGLYDGSNYEYIENFTRFASKHPRTNIFNHYKVNLSEFSGIDKTNISNILFEFYPSDGANQITVWQDNIYLSGGPTHYDWICAGPPFGRWLTDLEPTDVERNQPEYFHNDNYSQWGAYKFACDYSLYTRWTGEYCCGDDAGDGEFYADKNAGCFNGEALFSGERLLEHYSSLTPRYGIPSNRIMYSKGFQMCGDHEALGKVTECLPDGPGCDASSQNVTLVANDQCSVQGDYFCDPNGWAWSPEAQVQVPTRTRDTPTQGFVNIPNGDFETSLDNWTFDFDVLEIRSAGYNDEPNTSYIRGLNIPSFSLGRSYNLFVFDSNWQYMSSERYDVHDKQSNADILENKLKSLKDDQYIVIVTHDEPQKNLDQDLMQELKRFGASQDALDMIEYRGSYILVGQEGVGKGNALAEKVGFDGTGPIYVNFRNISASYPYGVDGSEGIYSDDDQIQSETVYLVPGLKYEFGGYVNSTGNITLHLDNGSDLSIESSGSSFDLINLTITPETPLSGHINLSGKGYFDNIYIKQIEPDGNDFDTYQSSCCPSDRCWNGFKCVANVTAWSDNTGPDLVVNYTPEMIDEPTSYRDTFPEPGNEFSPLASSYLTYGVDSQADSVDNFVCYSNKTDAYWRPVYFRSTPDNRSYAYCYDSNECWNGSSCVSAENWGNYYCDSGNWYSRSAILADSIINMTGVDEDTSNYTLSCVDSERYPDLIPRSGGSIYNWSSVCIFKNDSDLAMGVAMEETDKGWEADLYYLLWKDLMLKEPSSQNMGLIEKCNKSSDDFEECPENIVNETYNPAAKDVFYHDGYNLVIITNYYEVAPNASIEGILEFFPKLGIDSVGEQNVLGDYPANVVGLEENLRSMRGFDRFFIRNKDTQKIRSLYDTNMSDPLVHLDYNLMPYADLCSQISQRYDDGNYGNIIDYGNDLSNCTNTTDNNLTYFFHEDGYAEPHDFVEDIWNSTISNFESYSRCVYNASYQDSFIYPGELANFTRDANIVFDRPMESSCCSVGECWDGYQCIAGREESDLGPFSAPVNDRPPPGYAYLANTSENFICYNVSQTTNWSRAYLKTTQDRSHWGYCFNESQCGYYNSSFGVFSCVEDEWYVEDHYCDNGSWSTRTKQLALTLLNITSGSNYTLYCDSREDLTINMSSFIGDGGPEEVESMCYLIDGDRRVMGAVLNRDENLVVPTNFLGYVLTDNFNICEGDGGSGYESCDGTDTVWYNNITTSVVYSDTAVILEDETIGEFILRLISDPIGAIQDWIKGTAEVDNETYAALFEARFKKLYMFNNSVRDIFGTFEEDADPYEDSLSVTYTPGSEFPNICDSIDDFNRDSETDIICDETSDEIYIATNSSVDLWQNMTSSIRPTGIPTPSACVLAGFYDASAGEDDGGLGCCNFYETGYALSSEATCLSTLRGGQWIDDPTTCSADVIGTECCDLGSNNYIWHNMQGQCTSENWGGLPVEGSFCHYFGDYDYQDQFGCCEDDASEFFIMGSIGDSASACCDGEIDCSYQGECYENEEKISIKDTTYRCLDRVWIEEPEAFD